MTSCCDAQFFTRTGSSSPSLMSSQKTCAAICSLLILQSGAVYPADDLAVLVGVDGLASRDHHQAKAAPALGNLDRLRHRRENVAGADLHARVIELATAVKGAQSPPAGAS